MSNSEKPMAMNCVLKQAEIDEKPAAYSLEATAEERTVLSERFGLQSFDHLEAQVTVARRPSDQAIEITGQVIANLAQTCVATLSAVPEEIDASFHLLLVDEAQAQAWDREEYYLDDTAPEYDALEGESVDLGEIIAQTVSIHMNPFPRSSGELDQPLPAGVTVEGPELEKPNPFAALSKLKDKS